MADFKLLENRWYSIELEHSLPLKSTTSLKIKSNAPQQEGKILIHLDENQLRKISEELEKVIIWGDKLRERAENEAYLILDMELPAEVGVKHLWKEYKENKEYAKLLKDTLVEKLDFRRDQDYDKPWRIEWFEKLCDISSEWSSLEKQEEKIKNTSVLKQKGPKVVMNELFHDHNESASDYWKQVAEDSGMTLEEYFNSED